MKRRVVTVGMVVALGVIGAAIAPASAFASTATYASLTTTQQEGVVDGLVLLANDGDTSSVPYTDGSSLGVGENELTALDQYAATHEFDLDAGTTEIDSLEALGMFDAGADSAGGGIDGLIPSFMEFAEASDGSGLVLEAPVLIGGAIGYLASQIAGVDGPVKYVQASGAASIDSLGLQVEANSAVGGSQPAMCHDGNGFIGAMNGSGYWIAGADADYPCSVMPTLPIGTDWGALDIGTPCTSDGCVGDTHFYLWDEGDGCTNDVYDQGSGGLFSTVLGPEPLTNSNCSAEPYSYAMNVVNMADIELGPLEAVGQVTPAADPVDSPVSPGSVSQTVNGSPATSAIGTTITEDSTIEQLVATTAEQPADNYVTVPPCDSTDYPEQFVTCQGAVQEDGFTVVEQPVTDPTCEGSSWCYGSWDNGNQYDTQDAPGTVEGMSTVDSGTYTEAGGQTIDQSTITTIYIFVAGYVPSGATVTAPNCAGLTVPACKLAFEQAGWPYGDVTVNWIQSGSVPLGDVATQDPAGGAVVTLPLPADATVTLGASGIYVPAPTPNEVYTSYSNDLETAGFTVPEIDVTILTPAEFDPGEPDDGVVSVEPTPGTVVQPGTNVTVRANPDTTPTTGGCTTDPDAYDCGPPDPFPGPTVDPNGLDFPSVPTPCRDFPFGAVCWVVGIISSINAAPVAPNWDIQVPYLQHDVGGGETVAYETKNINLGCIGGSETGSACAGGVDTSTIMQYVRPILLALFVIGFLLWLAKRQAAGSRSSAADGYSGDGSGTGNAPYFEGEAHFDE